MYIIAFRGVIIELVNEFIDHLYTRLGTAINCSVTGDLHNSQIITVPATSLPVCCTFTSRFLATLSNSGDSSTSRFHVISSQPPVQNYLVLLGKRSRQRRFLSVCGHAVVRWLILLTTELSTELIAKTVLARTSRHRPHRKHSSSIAAFVSVAVGTCLPSRRPEPSAARTTQNTVLLLFRVCMLRALPSNGRYLQSHCLATGLYAIIYTRILTYAHRPIFLHKYVHTRIYYTHIRGGNKSFKGNLGLTQYWHWRYWRLLTWLLHGQNSLTYNSYLWSGLCSTVKVSDIYERMSVHDWDKCKNQGKLMNWLETLQQNGRVLKICLLCYYWRRVWWNWGAY
jgi:hypothetical protein